MGDQAFKKGWGHLFRQVGNGRKIAVVGSGPSGIGCTYYLLKSGYHISLFEAKPEIGGLLRYGIPEFRLPRKILAEEWEMVFGNRVDLHVGMMVGRDVSWDELKKDYEAVFAGTGAQKAIMPSDFQERGDGVMEGFEFLQNSEGGVLPVRNRRVLILGGGNTAIDVARVVLRLGGQPVILYRRGLTEMPAFEDEIREAEEEGVEISAFTSAISVLREKGRLRGVNCVKTRITDPASDNRPQFEMIAGTSHFIQADAVITAFGHMAEEKWLPTGINMEEGAVLVSASGATNINSLFAGGDLTPGTRTVIHALASGRQSAIGLDCHLNNCAVNEIPENQQTVKAEDINHHYFGKKARQQIPAKPPDKRIRDFSEIKPTMPSDMFKQEAERCFQCGFCTACGNCAFFCPDLCIQLDSTAKNVQIDENYCKGCCLCVEECPCGVISVGART